MADIPTIDFGPFMQTRGAVCGETPTTQQKECAHQINEAFQVHGFLFLKNIGVTAEEVQMYYDMAESIFSLPAEYKQTKLLQRDPVSNIGYTATGSEILNKKRAPDLKETYTVRNLRICEHDFSACPSAFGKLFRQLWEKMEKASCNFSVACAIALNLPYDYFLKALKSCDNSVITLNYYPACEYEPGKSTGEDLSASLRVGEHTDFGMYTILFNDKPGLQVKSIEGAEVGGDADGEVGGWLDVPVAGGETAIINIGALMARWTNDVWRATAHRVIVPRAGVAESDRYSIACFLDPHEDYVVEVHPSFVEKGAKAKYDPITTHDYILAKRLSAYPDHLNYV